MAGLRPVSELGLADPTDIARPEDVAGASDVAGVPALTPEPTASEADDGQAAPAVPAPAPPRSPRPRRHQATSRTTGTEPPSPRSLFAKSPETPKSPAAVVGLADEPTIFVQIMVPGELQERLADVSHVLAADHRKLRHHKTILGALLWRHVDPDDPERMWQLGTLLDAYLETDLSEAPAEIKVGAHLPYSLKYKLEGAALALRRTRRAASAKAVLSALIWRYVDTDTAEQLVELLAAYREASRPKPLPLGSSSPAEAVSKEGSTTSPARGVG